MKNPPSGNVTFLFTDIEGSTMLAQTFRESHSELIAKHHSILEQALKDNGGHTFKTIGDAFCSSFSRVEEALNAAVTAQVKLEAEDWGGAKMKVRMGIHAGYAEWNGHDYMGYLTLARTNRIMSAAHGGQILVSEDAVRSYPEYNEEYTAFPFLEKSKEGKLITLRSFGKRRLKDLIEPVVLFQAETEFLRTDFPPIFTLDETPNNLPVQLTSFVGRLQELGQLKDALTNERLVSVIGPGGTGKSRIALQLAADSIDSFPNGVWLIELASLNDPALLFDDIAGVLGIIEMQGKNAEDAVLDYLKDKNALLIIDNCEHLIKDVSQAAEKILRRSASVKIIATSREALQCSGESVFVLSSLQQPESGIEYEPEELSRFESVRLFIERALAVNSAFRINKGNAGHIKDICIKLDGIPLAIELAAVRLKVLSPEMILKKLDDRFKLLTGGNRTALPRQQTLRAMIDWSYDLLDEKEKLLFARLSVFSGGWTLEAAEAVCPDEELDEYEVLDLMTNLVDKSLVNTKDMSEGKRFYMLETIRQYAGMVSKAGEDLRRKHLMYFEHLSMQWEWRNNGLTQNEWITIADADKENIRLALKFACSEDLGTACRITQSMTDLWQLKGRHLEAREFCNQLFERKSELNNDEIGNLYYTLALMDYESGNVQEAEKKANVSHDYFRRADNKEGIAKTLNMKGVVLNMDTGSMKEAEANFEEAIRLFEEMGTDIEVANTRYNLSFTLGALGDRDNALKYKLEALDIYRNRGETYRVALVLTSLSSVHMNEGRYDEAVKCINESLGICELVGSRYLEAANKINLGSIYTYQGVYDKALSYLNDGIRISSEYGFNAHIIPARYYIGTVQLMMEKYSASAGNFSASIRLSLENGIEFFHLCNISGLARAFRLAGEHRKSAVCMAVFLVLRDDHRLKLMKKPVYDLKEEIRMSESLYGNELREISTGLKGKSKDEAIDLVAKILAL